MEIVCIQEFGNCKVGDVREVPDDSDFSPVYFAVKPEGDDPVPAQLPADFAQASPKASGVPEGAVEPAEGVDSLAVTTVPLTSPAEAASGNEDAEEAKVELAPSGDPERMARGEDTFSDTFGSPDQIVNLPKK